MCTAECQTELTWINKDKSQAAYKNPNSSKKKIKIPKILWCQVRLKPMKNKEC